MPLWEIFIFRLITIGSAMPHTGWCLPVTAQIKRDPERTLLFVWLLSCLSKFTHSVHKFIYPIVAAAVVVDIRNHLPWTLNVNCRPWVLGEFSWPSLQEYEHGGTWDSYCRTSQSSNPDLICILSIGSDSLEKSITFLSFMNLPSCVEVCLFKIAVYTQVLARLQLLSSSIIG